MLSAPEQAPRLRRRSRWLIGVRESNLPAMVRLVAHTLGTFMDADGNGARPSYARIAAGTGLDRRTVIGAVKQLRAEGWIDLRRGGSRKGGERTTNAYAPTIPDAFEAAVERALTGGRDVPSSGPDWWPPRARLVNVVRATGGRDVPQALQEPANEPTAGAEEAPPFESPWHLAGLKFGDWMKLSKDERSRRLVNAAMSNVEAELGPVQVEERIEEDTADLDRR